MHAESPGAIPLSIVVLLVSCPRHLSGHGSNLVMACQQYPSNHFTLQLHTLNSDVIIRNPIPRTHVAHEQVRRSAMELVPLLTLPQGSPAARQLLALLLTKTRDK